MKVDFCKKSHVVMNNKYHKNVTSLLSCVKSLLTFCENTHEVMIFLNIKGTLNYCGTLTIIEKKLLSSIIVFKNLFYMFSCFLLFPVLLECLFTLIRIFYRRRTW